MEIKIYDYGMNGEGVGAIDGKIILTNNALIGETVDAQIIEDNKNYATANVVNVIQSSPNRTKPKCPYFNMCGGCQLQHMTYDEQLKFKTLNIKKTLKKIAEIDFEVSPTVPCLSNFEYRNKMSFTINKENCGLLKHNSKDIVEISSCPLATNNINKVLSLFKEYLKSANNNNFKNIVVRDIENQILVGVVTSKHIDLNPFYKTLSQNFNQVGLYEVINTRKDSVILAGKVQHIAGIKNIKINNFGLTYSVDLMGFHQTNIEIQNKLYEKVLEYIQPKSNVFNGFSGQGLLSAVLAKKAHCVYGVEINKNSHQSAEELKKTNKITNLTNICGDFHKYIQEIQKHTDTLILDPTKKGCGKQVMSEIVGFKNIIYISCNPIALAKDLREIKDKYIIEQIIPFDMFPNTSNVETLVKLKLKG